MSMLPRKHTRVAQVHSTAPRRLASIINRGAIRSLTPRQWQCLRQEPGRILPFVKCKRGFAFLFNLPMDPAWARPAIKGKTALRSKVRQAIFSKVIEKLHLHTVASLTINELRVLRRFPRRALLLTAPSHRADVWRVVRSRLNPQHH